MKVAIVCNVKPQEVLELEGQEEPPSLGDLPQEAYAEWDSAKTIKAVFSSLKKFYDVSIILAQGNLFEKLSKEKFDFVFNMAEGLNGSFRESLVPAILEELKIPYTGSDPLTLGICLDKVRTKEILSYHSINTPEFKVIHNEEELKNFDIEFFPVILKPIREGSSKGVFNDNVCFDRKNINEKIFKLLKEYNQPVLIEKFLQGREFTVAVLGNYPKLEILPIVEINFSPLPKGANPIYSYEAKWVWDKPENPLPLFKVPANIDRKMEEKIKKIVTKTIKIFEIRDWCRVDIRLDENEIPNILELNPLPGIIPGEDENSCFPKAAEAAGLSYEELILKVMKIARERYEKSINYIR